MWPVKKRWTPNEPLVVWFSLSMCAPLEHKRETMGTWSSEDVISDTTHSSYLVTFLVPSVTADISASIHLVSVFTLNRHIVQTVAALSWGDWDISLLILGISSPTIQNFHVPVCACVSHIYVYFEQPCQNCKVFLPIWNISSCPVEENSVSYTISVHRFWEDKRRHLCCVLEFEVDVDSCNVTDFFLRVTKPQEAKVCMLYVFTT